MPALVEGATILDEVGRPGRAVSVSEVAGWKNELHRGTARRDRAVWHFDTAQSLVSLLQQQRSRAYGLARYDSAVTLFRDGAYTHSMDAFKVLLAKKTRLEGYDLARCALFLRHASVCVCYHAQRSDLGIPEPPQLDPNCGAAGIAVCLRTLHLPYDFKTVRSTCRVTGLGRNIVDLVNACKKVGGGKWVTARVVGVADDEGLKRLPLPAVAYVEHDHFIAVTRADASGVDYVCSDCGPWPGGAVHLTWKKWHALEGSLLLTIVRKGSAQDSLLQRATALVGTQDAPERASLVALKDRSLSNVRGIQVALVEPRGGRHNGFPRVALRQSGAGHAALRGVQDAAVQLAAHLVRDTGTNPAIACGDTCFSLHCAEDIIACLMGCETIPGCCACQGPLGGDPVNLATLEEEYEPAADLTVYNPVGPSVSWQRLYNSLRSNAEVVSAGLSGTNNADAPTYDYGLGWSNNYASFVTVMAATTTGTGIGVNLVLPNGAAIAFTTSAAPTSSTTDVLCTSQAGAPCQMDWCYNTTTSSYYFVITWTDGSKWQFGQTTPGGTVLIGSPGCSALAATSRKKAGHAQTLGGGGGTVFLEGGQYYLLRIENSLGQGINFSYSSGPLLSSITSDDTSAAPLLTIQRSGAAIVSVTDCYGRSVYYQADSTTASDIGGPYLSHVSQIVSTGTATPPDRYSYTYQATTNTEGEAYAQLHTITVPSPTGTGSSTATINYDPTSHLVTSVVDANGNTRSYSSTVGSNNTTVTQTDPHGDVVFTFNGTYDNNMSGVSKTDGAGNVLSTATYADPNDPYRPSKVVDALERTVSETWDAYGHLTSYTSVRGVTTAYTYTTPSSLLGRVATVQTYGRGPINYTYVSERSGLVASVTAPGPSGSGASTVTSSITYTELGQPLTVTTPGNGTVSSKTTTYGYTSDGSYSQAEAYGEPLTVSDNLGDTSHFRYDAQGNRLASIDAIGNEWDSTFDITNRPLSSIAPATGQTGPGRGHTDTAYLYPGGGILGTKTYDESGTLMRQVNFVLGAEGEMLGTNGSSADQTTTTFDALYRQSSVSDGNGNVTGYFYNTAGYLDHVVLPDSTEVQYPLYDLTGRLEKAIDARSVETDYGYDSAGALNAISYPATPALNAGFTYDSYGRQTVVGDAAGARQYAYGDVDELTSATTTYTSASGSALPAVTLSYTYHPDGSRSSMTTPAGTFTYGFDGAGRPAQMTNPAGATTTWSLLANGWLRSRRLHPGLPV